MSHQVQIFAGPIASLQRLNLPPSRCRLFVQKLGDDLGAVPIALDEDDNLAGWGGCYRPDEDSIGFHQGDESRARGASEGGALAYIETNYYGGQGYQAAALWIDGTLTFGPVLQWSMARAAVKPIEASRPPIGLLQRAGVWLKRQIAPSLAEAPAIEKPDAPPINQALRGLGIKATEHDEYTIFGLKGVRSNEDFPRHWIEWKKPD